MKQLILFPVGSISSTEKARLSKEGFIAIECDTPSAAVAVLPGAPLASADDLLMAAMFGLNVDSPYTERHGAAFTAKLFERMKNKEGTK